MNSISNVLLIDDDYATNYLHKYLLEESGKVENIHTCTNSFDALSFLSERIDEENIPDLIFVDINLPAENGWTFLDKYKALTEGKPIKTRIIMLSTSSNPKDVEMAESYTCVSEYIVKPLSSQVIEQILSSL